VNINLFRTVLNWTELEAQEHRHDVHTLSHRTVSIWWILK